MQRLKALEVSSAPVDVKNIFDAMQQRLGKVPNLLRTLGNSAAALDAYVQFSAALSKGLLTPKVREQIAVAVAEANSCEYCLSAHTAIGKMVGLSEHELAASRKSRSEDPKTDAALHFAHELVVRRGELDNNDIETVRKAGYSDGEIAEIVANVALNVFTNYFNLVANTEVDFPKVTPAVKHAVA